jgi:ubiquinone/menaquinone biosynthesis C-methylase UbiE
MRPRGRSGGPQVSSMPRISASARRGLESNTCCNPFAPLPASSYDPPVIYQHPLAYLLGLEGIASLRAFAGEYDRAFTEARLAESRALLDSIEEWGHGVTANPVTTMQGYADWAPCYDQPGNQLIDLEQPVVWDILAGLPIGVALDAACGTGRHTAYLAALGHRVIGVDSSAEMLARARTKLADGEFHQADLHQLPLPDEHVDVIVCALALTHVPELAPVLAEFVRVLRPGGHLVISDSRGLIHDTGLPLARFDDEGHPGYMPTWARLTSDYLVAALPVGLQVRRCEEPRTPCPVVDHTGTPPQDAEPMAHQEPGTPPDIWSLHAFAPDATNAAYRGNPAAIIWHFQLAES